MAYSRWGTSYWHTYWVSSNPNHFGRENRHTATLVINTTIEFSAKRLREDLTGCLDEIADKELQGADKIRFSKNRSKLMEELETYIFRFLKDVDTDYPKWSKNKHNKKRNLK